MEREEIKSEIVARLRLEDEVRQELKRQKAEPPPPAGRFSRFTDSKVGALVATAILSGLLVPSFQCSQERFRWREKNQYDTLQRQLGSIRESLDQFVEVQVVNAKVYHLGRSLLERSRPIDDATRTEFRSFQEERIKQNAAFAATIFYFPADFQTSIREAWNAMLAPVQDLDGQVASVLARPARAPTDLNETALALDDSLNAVNTAYDGLVFALQQQLREVEHASSEFQQGRSGNDAGAVRRPRRPGGRRRRRTPTGHALAHRAAAGRR